MQVLAALSIELIWAGSLCLRWIKWVVKNLNRMKIDGQY